MTANETIPFPRPGETLRKDFLKPLGMSVIEPALARDLPPPSQAGL